MKAAFHSSLVTRHFPLPLLLQPEKQGSRGRGEGDAVGAVGGADGITASRPAARRRQIPILLQGVAASGRPRHGDRVPTMRDGQDGKSCRLHDGDQAPETAGQRIIIVAGHRPTVHRTARIRLADGAAHGISCARAGAAATSDLIPVYRVALREKRN